MARSPAADRIPRHTRRRRAAECRHGLPEAALAREIELPYAAIAVIVNHAAGRGDSAQEVSMERIAQVLETAMQRVRTLLEHVALMERA